MATHPHRRFAHLLRAGGLVLALAIAVAAQGGVPAYGQASPEELTGMVSGFVIDEDTAAPLDRVCVNAWTREWAFAAGTQTNARGYYEITALAPGEYRIQFTDCARRNYVMEYYNDKDPSTSDLVPVTAGQTTTGVHAALARGASITGRITTMSGRPVGFACVRAYDVTSQRVHVGGVTDEAHGDYSVTGLPEGDFKLEFRAGSRISFSAPCDSLLQPEWYDDAADMASATVVHVPRGGVVTGIDAALAWRPALRVGDSFIAEGHAGDRLAAVSVTLLPPSTQPVSVGYSTGDGHGAWEGAKAPADYSPTSGTLTFAPGETSKLVEVAIHGDTEHEGDQQFWLHLHGAVNAPILDSGILRIRNDDPGSSEQTLSVSDVEHAQAGDGTHVVGFTVSLSRPAIKRVAVDYTTADGTAVSGEDYERRRGRLVFPRGTTSLTVVVPVHGSYAIEPRESFHLVLSKAKHALLEDPEGTATIFDRD